MKAAVTLLSLVLISISIMAQDNIYAFKVNALDGSEIDFSTYKGKKILIVNTASECGFTPQYEQLQALWESKKNDNLVIICFPANNFGKQEPGSDDEIASFCKKNYGVTFPMASKVSVKGDDIAPHSSSCRCRDRTALKLPWRGVPCSRTFVQDPPRLQCAPDALGLHRQRRQVGTRAPAEQDLSAWCSTLQSP